MRSAYINYSIEEQKLKDDSEFFRQIWQTKTKAQSRFLGENVSEMFQDFGLLFRCTHLRNGQHSNVRHKDAGGDGDIRSIAALKLGGAVACARMHEEVMNVHCRFISDQ